jgi:2'-5' RNA ligase
VSWGRGTRSSGPRRFARMEDDPPDTSRLFIAVPVADEVRHAVGALMEQVAGASIEDRAYGQPRWVRVDGLHLTLRFLGPTPNDRQSDLTGVLQACVADVEPFDVALSGAGAFPNPARPRVLWVGITSGAAQLGALATKLSGELERLGWPPEDRPFAPHLTLARTDGVPGAADKAQRLMELARDLDLSWRAERLVLYRSVLGRGPARYDPVAEAALTEHVS